MPGMRRKNAARMTVLVFALAVIWIIWWIWPERPLRSWQLKNLSGRIPELAADGRTALIHRRVGDEIIQPVPNQKLNFNDNRTQLANLTDGRELLPDEFSFDGKLFNNGTLLAVEYRDYRIDVFDAVTAKKVLTIPPRRSNVYRRFDVSFDGPYLLLTEWSGRAHDANELWDAKRGVKIMEPVGYSRFSSHGIWLVSRTDSEATITEPATGKEKCRIKQDILQGVRELDVRPDGGLVAINDVDSKVPGMIRVYSLPALKLIEELPTTPSTHSPFLSFSSTGRFLTARQGGAGRIWDLAGSKAQRIAAADSASAYGVSIAPDDASYLIHQQKSNSPTMTWELFRTGDAAPIQHGDAGAQFAAFSKSGKWMALGTERITLPKGHLERIRDWVYQKAGFELMQQDTWLIDTATGHIVRQISEELPIGFSDNETAIWTVFLTSIGQHWNMRLSQWPLQAPGPPWWLWLVTVGGVGLIVFDFKHRRRAGDASPQLQAKSVV
jgi:hypothetical protein